MDTVFCRHVALVSVLLALGCRGDGADAHDDPRDAEIRELRALVTALDARVRALEKPRAAEAIDPPVPDTPVPPAPVARLEASDRGFALTSPDREHILRFRGLLQVDGRWYPGAAATAAPDTWLVRRARVGVEGRITRNVEFVLTPEFAGGSASLLDASANIGWRPAVQVQIGRFKAPVGLEQMQSDSRAFFAERAFPSQLLPNRDLGVMVHGDFDDERWHYAVGVFNGVGDGGSAATTDGDRHKDLVARVFVQPFRSTAGSMWSGLGLGFGAATGRQAGTAGLTTGYRTDGQQSLFRYRSGAEADGRITRFSPQVSWYHGPVGLLAEYVESRAAVAASGSAIATSLRHRAWQLAGGWVLSGEDASYQGVVPRAAFDPAHGVWGAWEVTARLSRLDLDDGAFPVLADPAASARAASALGLGLNWHVSRNLRATLDYFHTDFTPAPGAPLAPTNPVLVRDEEAVLTRLQLVF